MDRYVVFADIVNKINRSNGKVGKLRKLIQLTNINRHRYGFRLFFEEALEDILIFYMQQNCILNNFAIYTLCNIFSNIFQNDLSKQIF